MVPPEQVEALKQSGAGAFDARFVALMTHHHQGAVVMADEAFHKAGDRRLRLMSHAIRHEQRGEVELMRGTRGFAPVWAAVLNMLLPTGAPRADQDAAWQITALGGPDAICCALSQPADAQAARSAL
jgi:hypothetical protein